MFFVRSGCINCCGNHFTMYMYINYHIVYIANLEFQKYFVQQTFKCQLAFCVKYNSMNNQLLLITQYKNNLFLTVYIFLKNKVNSMPNLSKILVVTVIVQN